MATIQNTATARQSAPLPLHSYERALKHVRLSRAFISVSFELGILSFYFMEAFEFSSTKERKFVRLHKFTSHLVCRSVRR
jgi:hypothetical protein